MQRLERTLAGHPGLEQAQVSSTSPTLQKDPLILVTDPTNSLSVPREASIGNPYLYG